MSSGTSRHNTWLSQVRPADGTDLNMGRLIAIEGIDGSGKGTQAALLRDALTADGCQTALLSFPRYQHTFFGQRIGEYLNGRYGGLGDVHPFLVSLLYAGDRLESRALLLEALDSHDVVILDRYVASNIAHQCAKLPEDQQLELENWIEHIEFELNRLPRPEITFMLDLPARSAQKLIARKVQRSYTNRSADLQEADADYLEHVRGVYLRLAAREPTWRKIAVEELGQIRELQLIAGEIHAKCLEFSPRLTKP